MLTLEQMHVRGLTLRKSEGACASCFLSARASGDGIAHLARRARAAAPREWSKQTCRPVGPMCGLESPQRGTHGRRNEIYLGYIAYVGMCALQVSNLTRGACALQY